MQAAETIAKWAAQLSTGGADGTQNKQPQLHLQDLPDVTDLLLSPFLNLMFTGQELVGADSGTEDNEAGRVTPGTSRGAALREAAPQAWARLQEAAEMPSAANHVERLMQAASTNGTAAATRRSVSSRKESASMDVVSTTSGGSQVTEI